MRLPFFRDPRRAADNAEAFARALEADTHDLTVFDADTRTEVRLARALAPADDASEEHRAALLDQVLREQAARKVPTRDGAGSLDPAWSDAATAVVVHDDTLGDVRLSDLEPIDQAQAAEAAAFLRDLTARFAVHDPRS